MKIDLKNWTIAAVSIIFISLYILALTGRLDSLRDREMVAHLEPIIFVIIGYYLASLPSQQNEKRLKEEIIRQTQRADAAQAAKEQALKTSESLDEKIKNAKTVFSNVPFESPTKTKGDGDNNAVITKTQSLQNSIATAINILKS